MKRNVLMLSLCYFFVILLSSCAVLNKDKQTGSLAVLEPQTILKFADVPVPIGFKLLPQNSYSFENAGLRVGVLKYQGKANPDQVISFYKDQMPMYNWNLLNIVEYGDRLLNFDREGETCIIGLLAKGRSVIITVSVGPKSQASKKSNKPVK